MDGNGYNYGWLNYCTQSNPKVQEFEKVLSQLRNRNPVVQGSECQLEQLENELYRLCEEIKKENNNMKEIKTQKIVDLFFNRELQKSLDRLKNDQEDILELDYLYKTVKSKLDDINSALFENGYGEIDLNLKNYTDNKTDGLLGKLNMENLEEQENILNKKDEVITMISACDTYEQEMEVLIAYKVVDKDGRLDN